MRYLLTRVLATVLVTLGVSVLIFVMIRLLPGDIVTIMIGREGQRRGRGGERPRVQVALHRRRARIARPLLGRPLHHDPTRGGPAEGEKHLKMYAATLAAYREAFGRSAPADIWPGSAEQYGCIMEDIDTDRIDEAVLRFSTLGGTITVGPGSRSTGTR